MASRLFLTLFLGVCLTLSACGDNGTSYTPCTSDAQCATGQVCVQGECQVSSGCESDDDCDSGRVCIEGECQTAECNEDADCAADEHCQDHVCVDGPPCDCTTDAECSAGEECDGCYCQAATCSDDSECLITQLCLDTTCQDKPVCTSDADCPSGTVCEATRCERPCQIDEDCPQLNTCVDGHCRQGCISDGLCPAGQICENNVCVDAECTTDAECSGALIRCFNGRCEPYTPCTVDADCGDPNFYCVADICEERPLCAIDDNCADAGLPDHACEDGHCQPVPTCTGEADCDADRDCIGGLCLPHVCRGPADCTLPLLCVGGECVNPGNEATVYEVIILNPGGPIREGQTIQLRALALTQAGQEVPGAELDWASSLPNRAGVDQTGLLTGGTEAGPTDITARAVVADVTSDSVTFTNTLDAQAGELRVSAVAGLGRTPVEGATVTVIEGANTQTVTTDADGVALFTEPAGPADVHVFADGFNYVSIIGTSSTDLLVPLPERSDRTAVGGFTGQMTYAGTGELSLGLAGVSVAGNLVDLDFTRLLGEVFYVPVPQIGNIPMPSQLVASIDFMGTNIPLKETYYVLGQTGLRSAWCMGGKIEGSVLWNLFSGGGTPSIEEVLIGLLPYFSLLNHGVRPTVDVFPFPLVVDADDIDNDTDVTEMRPDWGAMLDLDLAPDTPQDLAVQISSPDLPTHAGTPMRTAVFVTGALTPLGFTPLGMSAVEAEGGAMVPEVIRMAPAYGGLQVGGYAAMVMGFPVGTAQDMPANLAAVLMTADTLPTDVTFADQYLGFPEDADWDGASRTMVASPVSGATYYRSTLQGAAGGWEVYTPDAATVTFTLPAPPSNMPDLAAAASVTLDPIKLGGGLLYDDLVTFNGDDLDQISRLATAFSRWVLP